MVCGSLDGRRVWGKMDTCICMAELLCCAPETITTLSISYTPIQNKKLKKERTCSNRLLVSWRKSNMKDKEGREETWRKLCNKRKLFFKLLTISQKKEIFRRFQDIFMKQEQNTIFKTTQNVLLGKNTFSRNEKLARRVDSMFEEIFQEVNPNN